MTQLVALMEADMMGKRVDLVFEAYSGVAGAIDAGNVVPLAVAAGSRMASLPNLPTVAETLAGFESVAGRLCSRRPERRTRSSGR